MTFIQQFTCLISISGLKTGKQWSSWSWFQTKSTSSEVEGNYLKLEGDYSKSKECAPYQAWMNLKVAGDLTILMKLSKELLMLSSVKLMTGVESAPILIVGP